MSGFDWAAGKFREYRGSSQTGPAVDCSHGEGRDASGDGASVGPVCCDCDRGVRWEGAVSVRHSLLPLHTAMQRSDEHELPLSRYEQGRWLTSAILSVSCQIS